MVFILRLDESSHWCYKDRAESAYAIFVKYHGNANPDDEMANAESFEIQEALHQEKEVKSVSIKLPFKAPGNRKCFFILVTLVAFGQWSGKGLVSDYLTKILSSTGVETQHDQAMTNGTASTANWVTAVLAAILPTKICRRKTFLGGATDIF